MSIHKKIRWDNSLVKAKGFDLPSLPRHMPQLHLIGLLIGNSGSGKSNLLCNFLLEYQRIRAFDTWVLFSPTSVPDEHGLVSDPKLSSCLNFDYMFDSFTNPIFTQLVDQQKKMILEYRAYKRYQAIYNKVVIQGRNPLPEEMRMLEDNDFNEPINPNPSGLERDPTLLILFDDMTSTARNEKTLTAFINRIRHVNASIIQSCQFYAQANREVRKQTNLIFVWKSMDEKYMKDLWAEFASGVMTFDRFKGLMNSLESRHEFLMGDLKNPDVNMMWRRNLNSFVKLQ